jgi:hypothetical protein
MIIQDETFPQTAWEGATLPAHIIGMELNLNHLPDDAVHISRFGGVNVVPQADAVLHHGTSHLC